MYFMPAIVMPLVAIASTLLYLAIKVLSSSGVTCNNEKDNLKIYFKVEKNLKGSLDLILSPSPSVKIQIIGRKVCLRCKGKTLLGIVNKLGIREKMW